MGWNTFTSSQKSGFEKGIKKAAGDAKIREAKRRQEQNKKRSTSMQQQAKKMRSIRNQLANKKYGIVDNLAKNNVR